jgi:hypothetical protein
MGVSSRVLLRTHRACRGEEHRESKVNWSRKKMTNSRTAFLLNDFGWDGIGERDVSKDVALA